MTTPQNPSAQADAPRTPDLPDDDRPDLPMLAGDRDSLDAWLDFYRATLPIKVGGLTGEQLAQRPVATSTMSLAGLVRHLTEVELYWCGVVTAGEDLPDEYCTPQNPDGDFDDVDPTTAVAEVQYYLDTLPQCRAWTDAVTDLDAPVVGQRHGNPVNLRWILTHLIEEYARHLGHADLLRELVDGRTGY